METDRRLVEDVQHADQAGPDLGGKADALGLTARQGGRAPVERQVPHADIVEEAQALDDLAQDPVGDQRLVGRQVKRLGPLDRRLDGLVRGLVDGEAADRDGEALRLEASAVAVGARPQRHPLLDALLLGLRLRLVVATLEAGEQTLPGHAVRALAAEAVLVGHHDPLAVGALQEQILLGLGQLAPRHVERYVEALRDRQDERLEEVGAGHVPRLQRTAFDRHRRVGLHQLRIELRQRAETVAVGARAVRAVEGEHSRRELGERHAVIGAGEALGERQRLAVDHRDVEQPVGELERGLDRVGQAAAQIVLEDEPVHDDGEVVLELLVEHDLILEQQRLAIDLDASEALATQPLEHVLELALAATHDRRVDGELRPLGQAQHLIDDLLGALAGDRPPALGAMGMPDARVEQPEVVVDLGDGAHRRARVARRGLLVDRDGGRQPIDTVDVGFLHLAEELARVGAQRFDVAALPLGVERVEGQAGLAGARQARDADELVARQDDRDVLEVVLAGAANRDRLLDGHPTSLIADPAPAGRV